VAKITARGAHEVVRAVKSDYRVSMQVSVCSYMLRSDGVTLVKFDSIYEHVSTPPERVPGKWHVAHAVHLQNPKNWVKYFEGRGFEIKWAA
jgi:hypothetical protein